MTTNRWTHQETAFQDLRQHKHTALLMDMGTGKTKVQIDLLDDRECVTVLVVCPKSVISVWVEQVPFHSAREWEVVGLESGTNKAKVRRLREASEQSSLDNTPLMVVVNYDSVWRGDLSAVIRAMPWDAIVLDESHRAKSPNSKVSWYLSRLGKRVPYRSIMTGTLMPNNPLDVYAQYRFLDPYIFGCNYATFKTRYAVWGGFNGKIPIKFINQEELRDRVHTVAHRVELDDVIDLPEGTTTRYTVSLSPRASAIYKDLQQKMVAQTEAGIISTDNILTRMVRLHQLTGGYVQYDSGTEEIVDTAKQSALIDILTDIQDNNVVVFCLYRHDIEAARIAAHRAGRAVYELSGTHNDLTAWYRNNQLNSKNVLIVQTATGGLGIDLTPARYAIYYSMGFSLGDYLQSRARIRRPGQTRMTHYIHLVAEGTIDMHIVRAIEEKKEIAQYILDHME